jgi:hypothetical protein
LQSRAIALAYKEEVSSTGKTTKTALENESQKKIFIVKILSLPWVYKKIVGYI